MALASETNEVSSSLDKCMYDSSTVKQYLQMSEVQYPNETILNGEHKQICSLRNNSTGILDSCIKPLHIACNFNHTTESELKDNSTNSYLTKCLDHDCVCTDINGSWNQTKNIQCVCFPELEVVPSLNTSDAAINSSKCLYQSVIRTECENVSLSNFSEKISNSTPITSTFSTPCVIKPSNTTFNFEYNLNTTDIVAKLSNPSNHNKNGVNKFLGLDLTSRFQLVLFSGFLLVVILFFLLLCGKKIRNDRLNKKKEKQRNMLLNTFTET